MSGTDDKSWAEETSGTTVSEEVDSVTDSYPKDSSKNGRRPVRKAKKPVSPDGDVAVDETDGADETAADKKKVKKVKKQPQTLDFSAVIGLQETFRTNRRTLDLPTTSDSLAPQKKYALRQLHALIEEARRLADAGEGSFSGEISFPGPISKPKQQAILEYLQTSLPEVKDSLSIGKSKEKNWNCIRLEF